VHDGHHAGLVDKAVGQRPASGHVGQLRPMKRLTEAMVFRVFGLAAAGLKADLAAVAAPGSAPPRAGARGPRVGQAFGHAIAHRGHQRMGGAQVDAHRDAPLVRVGRLAGFGNLQAAP
jgi:hypothetical protein